MTKSRSSFFGNLKTWTESRLPWWHRDWVRVAFMSFTPPSNPFPPLFVWSFCEFLENTEGYPRRGKAFLGRLRHSQDTPGYPGINGEIASDSGVINCNFIDSNFVYLLLIRINFLFYSNYLNLFIH